MSIRSLQAQEPLTEQMRPILKSDPFNVSFFGSVYS